MKLTCSNTGLPIYVSEYKINWVKNYGNKTMIACGGNTPVEVAEPAEDVIKIWGIYVKSMETEIKREAEIKK